MKKNISIEIIDKEIEITFYPIKGSGLYRNTLRLPKKGVRIINSMKIKLSKVIVNTISFDIIKNIFSFDSRFSVKIFVNRGEIDNLGTGDLDNYSKAILDIITHTKLFWKDDKQVDELLVYRKKTLSQSNIVVTINKLPQK